MFKTQPSPHHSSMRGVVLWIYRQPNADPASISGVALPFEKRLWAIGHIPLGTVELIGRPPRVQSRLVKSEGDQSRSTEP